MMEGVKRWFMDMISFFRFLEKQTIIEEGVMGGV